MFRNKQTNELTMGSTMIHVLPWITSSVAALLAIFTFYCWSCSRDFLPSYMQFPAIVGGVCSCLCGIACVGAFFYLAKGERHWSKDKNRHARDRQQHKHPLQRGAHAVVFGLTIAAILTEGSYVYMLVCVVVGGKGDYCYTYSLSAKKETCTSQSGLLITINILLLVITTGCALWYEQAMQASIGNFNRVRSRLGGNDAGGYGGRQDAEYDHSEDDGDRSLPEYDDKDAGYR
ncbi:hypothetical protein JCM8202_005649 [Rhodotorula sphaerocarpa]